jgi:hypothetical protein
MQEKEIENYLIKRTRTAGGMCLKLAPVSAVGLPDRICLLPKRIVFFVELKRPNAKPRAIQEKRISELREMGFTVLVIDRKEQVDALLSSRISKVCD